MFLVYLQQDSFIKTWIKQNFVKEKITVWDFEICFKLYTVISVKIILVQNRVLFFLYKKVLRKAGVVRRTFAIIVKC